MNRALFLYWHGLGDVIILSPLLRHLHDNGYVVDLMCRQSVRTSKLLDDCPYVDKLIIVDNPWRSPKGFLPCAQHNVNLLQTLGPSYDWFSGAIHQGPFNDKIKKNFEEANLSSEDLALEVFIPDNIEDEIDAYVQEHYPDGFIFNHTMIEFHQNHNWNSSEWIQENLPDLPIVDTGYTGENYMQWEDIRYTFALLKRASHRVISSSVFVHACDAMGLEIDVVNYGTPDRKVWPHNQDLVKRIKESERWLKRQ